MKPHTVLLEDGTVGELTTTHFVLIGQLVAVRLHDENGMPIEVSGILQSVLIEGESK